MYKEYSIKELCKISTNKKQDEFVGIKYINEKPNIFFPLGFVIENDDILRGDLFNLFNKISLYGENFSLSGSDAINKYPFHSFNYILKDYLNNGYLNDIEPVYKKENKGKIDWNRTIKDTNPIYKKDGVIFIDFITKKNRIKNDTFLNSIHKFCVYISNYYVGFMYGNFKFAKPPKSFFKNANSKILINFLKKELGSTFKDAKKELIKHMINVLSSVGTDLSVRAKEYGTKAFHVIWENMIDEAFSKCPYDEKEVFPVAKWIIKNNPPAPSKLRPDTILVQDDSLFVIDAKYYNYNGSANQLPATSSIHKQITYAEHIEQNKKIPNYNGDNIYNVFILPGNCNDLKYIGYAKGSWKNSNKKYEKVHAVQLSINKLLNNSGYNKSLVENITDLIKKI